MFADINTFLGPYFRCWLAGDAAIPASLRRAMTVLSIAVTAAAEIGVLHNRKRQLPALSVGLGMGSRGQAVANRRLPESPCPEGFYD